MNIPEGMTPQSLIGKLAAMLHEQNMRTGRILAATSNHGNLISVGENRKSDKRVNWLLVLASNDCADHLEKWCNEQAKIRAKVAKDAGRVVYGSLSPGETWLVDDPPPSASSW